MVNEHLGKIGRRLALLAGLTGLSAGSAVDAKGTMPKEIQGQHTRDVERDTKDPPVLLPSGGHAKEMLTADRMYLNREAWEKARDEATALAISYTIRKQLIGSYRDRILASIRGNRVGVIRDLRSPIEGLAAHEQSQAHTKVAQVVVLWQRIQKVIKEISDDDLAYFKYRPSAQVRGTLQHVNALMDEFLDPSVPYYIRDRATLQVELGLERGESTEERISRQT